MSQRQRILFVSENVTMAQVVRLVVLAGALDPRRYELHFACSEFDDLVFAGSPLIRHRLFTIAREKVFRALAAGRRLYEKNVLARYVEDELELFARVQPHLVVGDFRLSLTVSAPLAGVPHAALINAHFSPYAARTSIPVPDHPIVKLLGVEKAQRYFPQAVPHVFEHFARPVNALRAEHGLPRIGSLLEVLTHGDYTLYADVPALSPVHELPASHRYLGPVLWSPRVAKPAWWSEVGRQRPCAYVTLGSSGNVTALPIVLDALATLPVDVMVATAGRANLARVPERVFVADFLPGNEAARRSAFVISNGGSATTHQALSEGVPVLGIASNLDQYLGMNDVEHAGAGILLRAGTLRVDTVRDAAARALREDTLHAAARRMASELARYDACSRFAAFVDSATGARRFGSPEPDIAPI